MACVRPRCLWVLILSSALLLRAQTPEWIWGPQATDGEARLFLREFEVPAGIERVVLTVAADNSARVVLDGKVLGRNDSWSEPSRFRIPAPAAGTHRLEIEAGNEGSAAGLLVRLELFRADGTRTWMVSDASWQTRSSPNSPWVPAVSLGRLGVPPWGDIAMDPVATPPSSLKVVDGFRVELVHASEPGQGSWVSMTVDDRGRLIVSPQGPEPLLRFTLDDAGKFSRIETIDVPVRGAMGLLWHRGVLYANAGGSQGYGLHRIRDVDGDDRFETVDLLRKWDGDAGEHGPHGIVAGPDGRLYVVNGNFVDLPKDRSTSSPVRNYADDQALPRLEDGNGFGAGRKPPGGYVVSLDTEGRDARIFAAGERNTYDIAFNADGELFGFDSDMEWDWGTPWYRPIRVNHIISGADHGFREGSAKWPAEHADALPPVLEVGIGSPTGVRFGTGTRFPAKYRDALYLLDWSYGRILAVHLRPEGSGYSASMEPFIQGRPLNVTDVEVGRDGAMYFTTGGRGTQSGLYRVAWAGAVPSEPAAVPDAAARSARELRHEVERLHGQEDLAAVLANWDLLGSSDRNLRHAMRLALESQPVAGWRERALAEERPAVGLNALLALVRTGNAADAAASLKTLTRWPLDSLEEDLFLTKLRVITVAFSRHGIPEAMRPLAIGKLGRQLPAPTWPRNRELVPLLVALGDPGVVAKALDLRDQAATQEEQLHYMTALRRAEAGWTPDLRQRYFGWFLGRNRVAAHPARFNGWFTAVGLKAANGASFDNFVRNLRREAFERVPAAEKGPLAAFLATGRPAVAAKPAEVRKFVRDWKSADLETELAVPLRGRDFARGRSVFREAQCAACHRFQGEGGAVGPDLTGVGTRYSRKDVWLSLTEPSRVVSEQYQARTLTLKNGTEVTGRVMERSESRIVLVTAPLGDRRTELKTSDVSREAASPVSPMPEGLLSGFSREEILDLLAYLESDGHGDAPAFQKR